MTRCIGWAEKEGRCENEAGTPWTPLWCPECDERRRAYLTAQFERLAPVPGADRSQEREQ